MHAALLTISVAGDLSLYTIPLWLYSDVKSKNRVSDSPVQSTIEFLEDFAEQLEKIGRENEGVLRNFQVWWFRKNEEEGQSIALLSLPFYGHNLNG